MPVQLCSFIWAGHHRTSAAGVQEGVPDAVKISLSKSEVAGPWCAGSSSLGQCCS